MEFKPLVSIIVPVYNSHKYLKKSLNSLINQTLKNIEIICIDDFSSDSSLKLLNELKKKDNRIRVIYNKQNLGPGSSRNKGLKIAKGKYIYFLDSDDWLEKNACELLYNCAEKKSADVVYAKLKFVFSNKIIFDKRKLNYIDLKNKDTIFRKNLLRKIPWGPCSKFIKRDLLIKNKIKFPNFHISEDMDFSYNVLFYAKNIKIINDYVYNYYLRENSLMAFTNPVRRIDNYFESIKYLKTFLKEKGIFRKYVNEYIYFKFYNYLAIYGVMYYSNENFDKNKYKKLIKKDKDFSFFKLFSLRKFDSVIIGSILIKLNLFNLSFRIREFSRILFGKWGKRNK